MILSDLAKYSMTRIVARSLRQLSFLFHTPLHSTSLLWGSTSEYCHHVWYGKTIITVLSHCKKIEYMCNRLYTISACDRRTDRQTDRRRDRRTSCDGIVRAIRTCRVIKTETSVVMWLNIAIIVA